MRRRARGFSLVELAIVLALIAVLAGLVVARFAWGGARQMVIGEARRLGNLAETCRERAMTEERLYALRVDAETGTIAALQPEERSAEALERAPVFRRVKLDANVRLEAVTLNAQPLAAPVVLYFDARGFAPPVHWKFKHAQGASVTVKFDALHSEAAYDEP